MKQSVLAEPLHVISRSAAHLQPAAQGGAAGQSSSDGVEPDEWSKANDELRGVYENFLEEFWQKEGFASWFGPVPAFEEVLQWGAMLLLEHQMTTLEVTEQEREWLTKFGYDPILLPIRQYGSDRMTQFMERFILKFHGFGYARLGAEPEQESETEACAPPLFHEPTHEPIRATLPAPRPADD